LGRIRRTDRLLTIDIAADAFVWFVAVLQILILNVIGTAIFDLSPLSTSFLLLPELLGVALGGLLAGWIAKGDRWYRVLTPAMFALAVSASLVALTPLLPGPLRQAWVVAMLALAGLSGGVMLVPMESFFQTRPRPGQKGTVIAVGNFTGFVGMSLSGVANDVMARLGMYPTTRFVVVGAMALLVALWLRRALRKEDRP
jgi:acyl-[acyl-carrier-protein]-phospholipid O-acyltransferase/long-chain-fatty-acid--[acyl-carrier-protein] ligase